MSRLLRSRLGKLGLSIFAALAIAGGALAYFTSVGHGAGTAAAGTVSEITLSAGTPTSDLYPGSTADVAISVSNPNGISLHVPSLVLDTGEITVDNGHSDCDTSKVHYTTQNNSGGGYSVPAGSSTLDLPGAISMDTSAASACQGATFTVYLKVGT